MLTLQKIKSDFLDATPQSGRFAGKPLIVQNQICGSPTCRCRDMTLSFFDLSQTPEITDATVPFALAKVDVFTRSISQDNSSKAGKDLISDFDENDWLLLLQTFYTYKQAITDAGNFSIDDFDFPIYAIESDGVHIGYREILPYSEGLFIKAGDEVYMAHDRYCIRSYCDCTEATIVFLTKNNISKIKNTIWINYKTGVISIEEEDKTNNFSANELYVLLLEKYPDLLKQLKIRRATLSDLYRKYKASKLPISSATKIGRNDPCSCGSGKKFKRCCAV